MLQTFEMNICAGGSLGLRLSRAPWDPYPWISSIQKQSCSDKVGLCVGDTVLQLNGCDVLGMKISDIAQILKSDNQDDRTKESATTITAHNNCNIINNNSSNRKVTVVVWRNKSSLNTSNNAEYQEQEQGNKDGINNAHNINQQSLQKFATCLQHIAQLLECPVCLDIIKPPGWQCCNGHVLCNNCRSRSMKCPVCRVPLGPRGRCLLSDKLYHLLAESFPCDSVRKSANLNERSSRKDASKKPTSASITATTVHDDQQQQQQQQQHQQSVQSKQQQKCQETPALKRGTILQQLQHIRNST